MSDLYDLTRAAAFAAEKHRDQRRKNAEKAPYINHPIEVCNILAMCGVTDSDTLVAALLHDTVEDTDTTLEELATLFNLTVVGYVREVTDDKTLPKVERKKLQVEHARTASRGATYVKMADKIHNCRSLLVSPPAGWDAKCIQGYMVWSKAVACACLENLVGPTIRFLESFLNDVFQSTFTLQGETYKCIPDDVNLGEALDEYYESMIEVDTIEEID